MDIYNSLILGEWINPNETVNISLTQVGGSSADLIGAAVTITDDDSGDTLLTTTWNGSTITTEIDVNTNYTVSVETIAGYLACEPQSYQAGYQTTRNISFQYRALGVFIEATDGTIYTSSTWGSSGKTANSVVLITENHSFRIALQQSEAKQIHTTYDPSVSADLYLQKIENEALAKANFRTDETQRLIEYNTALGTNTTTYAAPWANAFTFPKGDSARMATSGELWLIIQNKTAINTCMTACSGVQINGSYWSSTYSQGSGTEWIGVWFTNNTTTQLLSTGLISGNYVVLPVMDY